VSQLAMGRKNEGSGIIGYLLEKQSAGTGESKN